MINSIVGSVPRWMCSLSTLSSLSITLETLGEDDLQVLGSLPSLSELYIHVKKSTQGRHKRLVLGSGHPFRCLMRFTVKSDTMELRFQPGTMESLQTLRLKLHDVEDMLLQFGDFIFGLENLSSLVYINVEFYNNHEKMGSVKNAIEEQANMNQNKPKLTWKFLEKIRIAELLVKAAMNLRREIGIFNK